MESQHYLNTVKYWEDENVLKRFWNKVEKKTDVECWEWSASRNKYGYGRININKKVMKCHRLSFEIYYKRFISNGLCILHSCDNPKCVNPNHLSEGTHQDNMNDMINKGRHAKGEKITTSKLKENDIVEIRKLLKETNLTQKQIGKQFNIARSTISLIKSNKRWSQ